MGKLNVVTISLARRRALISELRFLIVVAVLTIIGFVFFPVQAKDAPLTPAEQHLVASGSRIVQRFQSASGLTAIVADNGTQQQMFYLTPDGKSMIVGIIFGADGSNISAADIQRVTMPQSTPVQPKMGTANPTQLLARAEKSQWIGEGRSGRVVYAIFDPNCPVCHHLHGELQQAVAAGKVQVRWIPVSILAESGAGTIAAIYGSTDRAAALGRAFQNILPMAGVTPTAQQEMARNLLLLRDTGYTGVPLLLYQQDGKARMHMGAPEGATLAAILASS